MFVPSESVFAEIHERFDEVVQRAYRARVVIVSPSLLLLSIQVIQAVLRDARLRGTGARDPGRGHEADGGRRPPGRARTQLASHFGMAQKDIDQILVSTEKVTKRSRSIEAIGLTEAEPARQLLAGGYWRSLKFE